MADQPPQTPLRPRSRAWFDTPANARLCHFRAAPAPAAEWPVRQERLVAAGGYARPESRPDSQELQRSVIGRRAGGMTLEPAAKQQRTAPTRACRATIIEEDLGGSSHDGA